jgi:hypothetical protein
MPMNSSEESGVIEKLSAGEDGHHPEVENLACLHHHGVVSCKDMSALAFLAMSLDRMAYRLL